MLNEFIRRREEIRTREKKRSFSHIRCNWMQKPTYFKKRNNENPLFREISSIMFKIISLNYSFDVSVLLDVSIQFFETLLTFQICLHHQFSSTFISPFNFPSNSTL